MSVLLADPVSFAAKPNLPQRHTTPLFLEASPIRPRFGRKAMFASYRNRIAHKDFHQLETRQHQSPSGGRGA